MGKEKLNCFRVADVRSESKRGISSPTTGRIHVRAFGQHQAYQRSPTVTERCHHQWRSALLRLYVDVCSTFDQEPRLFHISSRPEQRACLELVGGIYICPRIEQELHGL